MRLFKVITLVAMALSTTTAFAGEYKEIPADKLMAYQVAAVFAIKSQPLPIKCSITKGYFGGSMAEIILRSQTGRIEIRGSQPILIFEWTTDETHRSVAKIVSDADYKEFVSGRMENQELGDVNVGDLRNPVVAKGWIPLASAECMKVEPKKTGASK